jgi:phospholipid-translocating ATPase
MYYLETKNLGGGGTNLKPPRSVRATSTIKVEEEIERSSFCLDPEPPHQNLHLYRSVLRYEDETTAEQKQEQVAINKLFLQGYAIRNTNGL